VPDLNPDPCSKAGALPSCATAVVTTVVELCATKTRLAPLRFVVSRISLDSKLRASYANSAEVLEGNTVKLTVEVDESDMPS